MALRVGLVSRLDDQRALEIAATLARQLRKKGISVIAELDLAKRGRLGGGRDLSDLKSDLIVTVGGDVTQKLRFWQSTWGDEDILRRLSRGKHYEQSNSS